MLWMTMRSGMPFGWMTSGTKYTRAWGCGLCLLVVAVLSLAGLAVGMLGVVTFSFFAGVLLLLLEDGRCATGRDGAALRGRGFSSASSSSFSSSAFASSAG